MTITVIRNADWTIAWDADRMIMPGLVDIHAHPEHEPAVCTAFLDSQAGWV